MRVEYNKYGARRSEQTELRGMIILGQSGVKASGENAADRSGERTSQRDRRSATREKRKA